MAHNAALLAQEICDRIKEQADVIDALLNLQVISKAEADKRKADLAMEEYAKSRRSDPKNRCFDYSQKELEADPYKKDLLREQERWRMFDERTTGAAATEWEEEAKNAFILQAGEGNVTPLMAIIGAGLLFFSDTDHGRRYLIELLFKRKEADRVKAHNWYFLLYAGKNKATDYGELVEQMELPLYPFGDSFKELAGKNGSIIEMARKKMSGGSSSTKEQSSKLFDMEPRDCVGGAAPLQVFDAQGAPQPFFVDVQEIENYVNRIASDAATGDQNLHASIAALSRKVESLKKLCLAKTSGVQAVPTLQSYRKSGPTRPTPIQQFVRRTYSPPATHTQQRPVPGYYTAPSAQRQNGKWTGGESQAEPSKNWRAPDYQ